MNNRPLKAMIDIVALKQNLLCAKKRAATSRIWAVVKANAYGHCLENVYLGLQDADGFALLAIDEALLLRQMGWRGPILMLEGVFSVSELEVARAQQITIVIHQQAQLTMLLREKVKHPVAVYVKVNTGMNRLGFDPEQVPAVLAQMQASSNVGKVVLMTHFANADLAHGINAPLACFSAVPFSGMRCAANSAAILWHPESHFDWVRAGIMLYGASPSGDEAVLAQTGLMPVMSLRSQIIAVREIQAGETIGYGSIYRAPQAMRIGIVACGYADGYPRFAPNGTPVVVDGILTQTVGRVSMDMLSVDLTACPAANLGSSVELWGKQLPVDRVAAHCQTIGYELLASLTARVPVLIES